MTISSARNWTKTDSLTLFLRSFCSILMLHTLSRGGPSTQDVSRVAGLPVGMRGKQGKRRDHKGKVCWVDLKPRDPQKETRSRVHVVCQHT